MIHTNKPDVLPEAPRVGSCRNFFPKRHEVLVKEESWCVGCTSSREQVVHQQWHDDHAHTDDDDGHLESVGDNPVGAQELVQWPR